MDEFAKLAAPNTYAGDRGVETCGVLAGVERGGGLSVTHIILPPQTGQPDDCEVTDDEALLGYCLKHQLTAVGWIHTHPSQDCFLSALDLHTHAGYQSCLPEAIAIVVAPRDARCTMAVFRLTDGDGLGQGGLQLIQACERRGFHPHEASFPIYESSGHVVFSDTASLTVADLRGPTSLPRP